MNRRDLDDLSGVEIRRRLTQRGVPAAVADLLVARRGRVPAEQDILRILNGGRQQRRAS